MNKNLTELVFIIDKSGSMSGLEADTIGGFNSLIEKEKSDNDDVIVSTVLFNNKMDVIHDRVNIQKVNKMTTNDYYASGSTALLDAIGFTISHILETRRKFKDEYVPSKTMVVITTDGYENSSSEYSYANIKKLIEKQKELGWEFIFLGANIDVAKEAGKFGIDKDMAVKFNNDSEGVAINYKALACAIKDVKETGKVNKKWRKSIDEDYNKRG